LSAKEIAEELDELNRWCCDIIAELSQSKKEEVISELDDLERKGHYWLVADEDSTGGLMGKEAGKVNENGVYSLCKEMRSGRKCVWGAFYLRSRWWKSTKRDVCL
jgi:magnesium transporter